MASEPPNAVPYTNLFGQACEFVTLKEKVREKIRKLEPHSVHRYYRTSGCWQRLAKHPRFEMVTMVVIAANAVYMGVDVDYKRSASGIDTDVPFFFQFFSHFFCAYFSLEWIIRFMAFENKLNTMRDRWFVIDSLLLGLMVAETWVLLIVVSASGSGNTLPASGSALRLFRLMRLSRLLRILRVFPELMVLVKGVAVACKPTFYVLCLLLCGSYAFAIVLTQLSANTQFHEFYFSTVPMSMYHLLMTGTSMDTLAEWDRLILAESPLCLFLALGFVAFANVLILNVLTGVMTEVMGQVAANEREERVTQMVLETVQDCMKRLDRDKDAKISYQEFCQILEFPHTLKSLQGLGVNPIDLITLAEEVFLEDGLPIELDFDAFMEFIVDLRTCNGATLKDIKRFWMTMLPKLDRTRTSIQAVRWEMRQGVLRMEGRLGLALEEIRQLSGETPLLE